MVQNLQKIGTATIKIDNQQKNVVIYSWKSVFSGAIRRAMFCSETGTYLGGFQ